LRKSLIRSAGVFALRMGSGELEVNEGIILPTFVWLSVRCQSRSSEHAAQLGKVDGSKNLVDRQRFAA
jgi:hypothetical protein